MNNKESVRHKTLLFVYGFGLYGSFKSNITEAIVRAIPGKSGLAKTVFKVKFDAEMFQKTLNRIRPRYIIGMGQHHRAKKIRIERRARNQMAGNRRLKLIEKHRPAVQFATLRMPHSPMTTTTYDAGTYVCNFSMWQMSRWCRANNSSWTFLHVPPNTNIRNAVRYLLKTFSSLRDDRDQN